MGAEAAAVTAKPKCPECGRDVEDTNGWSLYLYCPVHGPAVPRKGAPPKWNSVSRAKGARP